MEMGFFGWAYLMTLEAVQDQDTEHDRTTGFIRWYVQERMFSFAFCECPEQYLRSSDAFTRDSPHASKRISLVMCLSTIILSVRYVQVCKI